ncbi:uncharacterized protein PRCAT00001133001 [Priceomyces carsonii]|uniref:uncharacterized protein n=1 Tax=Priceomyces carsonii TaxID=28549 RepID=UPI002ED77B93|nr:unnamed protein product [Priceomyces carsonii]
MSLTNKDVALAIINFLKGSVSSKQVSEDFADSMDVAIDCVADAFEVDKNDDQKVMDSKFGSKSLLELLEHSSVSKLSSSKEVSHDVKDKAESLKVEGNRAMSARKFDEAIAKYTEAINLDPSNVVFLSNRAAAYSSCSQHQKAVEDSEAAIQKDPNFSKAYSRLGLAQYALGNAKASMEAYKKGLDVEGDKKSDAMTRGYETAKRRVEEELEKSISSNSNDTSEPDGSQERSGSNPPNGMPDFSSMFGGNGGGMPSFSELMNNPQIMQAAQLMMSNPSALQGLMNNPSIRQMAENMGLGGENGANPNLSDIMNNPMLQNLASQFGGGANNSDNSSSNNNSESSN